MPKRKIHTCKICGYPSSSERGVAYHTTRSHKGPLAARNEAMVRMWEDWWEIMDIADIFHLHPSTVQRTLWRAMAYPKIYQSPEDAEFEQKVAEIQEGIIPISSRRKKA